MVCLVANITSRTQSLPVLFNPLGCPDSSTLAVLTPTLMASPPNHFQ